MFRKQQKRQKVHHQLTPNQTTGPSFTNEEIVDLLAAVEAINKRREVAGKDPSKCPKWSEVRGTMIELGHPDRIEKVSQVDYSTEELIRIKQLKENPSEADKKAMGEVTGGIWYKITQITNREFNVVRISGNVQSVYVYRLKNRTNEQIKEWKRLGKRNEFTEQDINTLIYVDNNFKKASNNRETD